MEEIWSRFADNDNKELDFLYNLIEESEKTFYIQFKESLQTVSVGGDIYNPTISFVANKRGGGVLSISKSNPPHLQNFAEELFHCYQHSEMNLFTTDYNFEFEVKLFASIVHRRNPLGGDMMSAAVENLIEYLGVQQYVAYNPQFVVNLNSDKFNEIYQKGLELFVHNNNQNDTGNDNYRVPGSMLAKPVNLKEFYSKFFNKK